MVVFRVRGADLVLQGPAPPGPRPGPFPWTPARPTWTPPSGPACSRCSIAADLGRRDESP